MFRRTANLDTYTLTVPSVLVPESFTWTVQVSNRQGNMARMGLFLLLD